MGAGADAELPPHLPRDGWWPGTLLAAPAAPHTSFGSPGLALHVCPPFLLQCLPSSAVLADAFDVGVRSCGACTRSKLALARGGCIRSRSPVGPGGGAAQGRDCGSCG